MDDVWYNAVQYNNVFLGMVGGPVEVRQLGVAADRVAGLKAAAVVSLVPTT